MPLKTASWAWENRCRIWTWHKRIYLSYCRLWHLYFAHSSSEEGQDFNQVVISRDYCFRSKSASKICHRYLSGKSSQKHTGLFGRTLFNSMLYMILILSPLFSNIVHLAIVKLATEPNCECPMRIPHLLLLRLAHVMTDFYHGFW